MPMTRDDKWLFAKLDEVWDGFFPDIPQDNEVMIVWGRRAKNRLGSIKTGQKPGGKHGETIITINSLFKDPRIPEFVIMGTIAHELAHYAHGFHSPLEKKFETPHAGGVVNQELKDRGLEKVLKMQKRWLRENWENYLTQNFPRKRKLRKRIRWI